MTSDPNIDRDKAALRETLNARRRGIPAAERAAASAIVCREAARLIDTRGAACVVSGFWPIGAEVDIRPLLIGLHEKGHPCALPAVVGKATPLAFRRWTPATVLAKSGFGLSQPGPEAETRVPDVLLVPLLAFDAQGYRLGWGAGYYDRTLAALRKDGDVTAIGVGFSVQRVDKLPCDRHDQRLDFMVTEKGAIAYSG